jgi:hypothetical protein
VSTSLKYCLTNNPSSLYPVIIGGWAVFHYAKSLGSRDIDIIFPTAKDRENILMKYYKENGYKEEGLFVKQYFKEVDTKNGVKKIILDACTHANVNYLHENTDINIAWNLTDTYYNEWDIEKGVISRVPTIELLMIYKIKALCDRRYDIQNLSIEGLDREYINSKIWKDEHDIKELSKYELNVDLFNKLLEETKFNDYAQREIERLDMKLQWTSVI